MSHQIWHAFYFDHGAAEAPCRTEVIEADNEEAAARVARAHLGGCERASLEAASWTQRKKLVIMAQHEEGGRGYLH
jgi:hypothetical protein